MALPTITAGERALVVADIERANVALNAALMTLAGVDGLHFQTVKTARAALRLVIDDLHEMRVMAA